MTQAVYQTLTSPESLKYLEARVGKGIVMTGKGYPDLASRALLVKLAQDNPTYASFSFLYLSIITKVNETTV